MNFYSYLTNLYTQFLSIFPAPLQWLLTLIVVIGLVIGFVNLIKTNWLFLILLIVLLPAVVPVFRDFFNDVYNFFLYLVHLLHTS